MASFLFYDTETTGLNSAFDQIITFAAIRTDLDLNEIERYELTIKLRPDIVPSPGAFITHRLMAEDLAEGVSEYEGAKIIHEIVNRPETISIGYNSLGFDDEFLRFTFYRNLLDPYSHQYANGCSRMDLLPITTLYRIFKPEIIDWPKDSEGKPSLKLELILTSLKQKLSREGGKEPFDLSGLAHNAMTDVKVTLALARYLMEEREIWRYSLEFFDKKCDRAKIESINVQFKPSASSQNLSPLNVSGALHSGESVDLIGEKYTLALMVSHKFGSDLMYMAPVIGIGRSHHYANQTLWLRLDREIAPPSGSFNPDELSVIRKKDGESSIILPPLERFWNRLSDGQKSSVEKNRSFIYGTPEQQLLFKKIVAYHREFKYPYVPEADLDSLLYQDSFFTRAEKREMEAFHKSTVEEKRSMVERMKPSRIKALATRILFRNYPKEALSPSIYDAYNSYMERVRCSCSDNGVEKLIGFKREERLIPNKAIEEITELRRNSELSDRQPLDGEQKKILEWIEGYILSI